MTTYTSRGVPMAEGTDPADIAARVNAVANIVHDRPGVSPLTTTERDALSGSSLWDGRVILNTTLDQLQRYDLGVTGWAGIYPANTPLGTLGYAQITGSQGGISTAVDITGLSIAVTVGTGRRIRISYSGDLASSVAGDIGAIQIKEGVDGTTLTQRHLALPVASAGLSIQASVILTPSAGAHTYNIRCLRMIGSGVIQHTASAGAPAHILVEDIGAA